MLLMNSCAGRMTRAALWHRGLRATVLLPPNLACRRAASQPGLCLAASQPDLLQAASAPDVEISALLTCNSISPAEEGGALYVCVPSTDGEHDGHDWADEVGLPSYLVWAGRCRARQGGAPAATAAASGASGAAVLPCCCCPPCHASVARSAAPPRCLLPSNPQQSVEMGAVAVLSERPLPDALLPVVVVPDTRRALSALADAFYERPSRRMRTVGLVGR